MAADETHHSLDDGRRRGISRFLPSLEWIGEYDGGKARSDSLAAVFVAALLVPQAMAYAQLAGLNPRVGLAAAIAPPLMYAVFGTSRYLSIGPVALLSLLTAATVSSAGDLEVGSVLVLVGLLAVLVGLIQVAIGVLRLGFVTNFISDPALSGFIQGAAVLILASQVPTFLGLDIDAREFIGIVRGVVENLENIQWDATILGGGALAAFLLLPRFVRWSLRRGGVSKSTATIAAQIVPIAIVAGAIAVTWAGLAAGWIDLPVVGTVPAGLPELRLPELDLAVWKGLIGDAVAIAILGFVIALGAANSLAGRERQSIDADNEAFALGMSNVAAGVSGGYPVGASLSRSAVIYDAGAYTPLGSVGAGVLILCVLLMGGPIFEYLPASVLAALIISAVIGLFKPRELWRFIRFSKADATVAIASLLATVFLGVRWGIAIGAGLSLLLYLARTSQPRVVIEGADRETGRMQDVDRRNVEEIDETVLVMRIDEGLYFANARHCEQELLAAVAERPRVRCVVLDMKSVGHIDASALAMLERVRDTLQEAGLELRLSNTRKPVLLKLRHMGFMSELPSHERSTEDAAREAAAANGDPDADDG